MGTFEDACSLVESLIEGSVRAEIVAAATSTDLDQSLVRLRAGMRTHAWQAGGLPLRLGALVQALDERTRAEGFHVLNDWDGIADSVNADIIPVDVLVYLKARRGAEPVDPAVLSILLDYYVMHLVALLSLRVWDDGDADTNLDRLTRMLTDLQGPHGSGQKFAANAETLLLLASSHFELHDRGYGALLERVHTLNRAHRAQIALTHAASMGSHLRFGFEATYAGSTEAMRADNVADYPWLFFAAGTLLAEYARPLGEGDPGLDREALVEAILNAVTADPGAVVEAPDVRDLFEAHRQALVDHFGALRPSVEAYSPLSFFFNFSHNIVKGTVIDALLTGDAWNLSFNDLLTGLPRGAPIGAAKEHLANTLMAYARSAPHRIRGQLMPVIVYDPAAGRRAFDRLAHAMRQWGNAGR